MINTDFLYNYPGFFSVRDQDYRFVYVNKALSEFLQQYYSDITSFVGLSDDDLRKIHAFSEIEPLFHLCHEGNEIALKQDTPFVQLIPLNYRDHSEIFNVVKYRRWQKNQYYIYSFSTCVTKLYGHLLQFEKESKIDSLSQLYNRKFLSDWVVSTGVVPVFTLIDLDHFKGVNDYFGHEAGDDVIIQFSLLLKRFFPNQDLIRFGGDEFLIISYEPLSDVFRTLTALLTCFESEFKRYPFLSFSFGCEFFQGTLRNTLSKIDDAMYVNKRTREKEQQYFRQLGLIRYDD
jgi:diguanylate cyclase (GGDEF)-like protein